MNNISNTEVNKIILKDEFITIGPYTLDIGKIINWTKTHSQIKIQFMGSDIMIFGVVDEERDEHREYNAPWLALGLIEKRFNALVTYLENRFKPKVIG